MRKRESEREYGERERERERGSQEEKIKHKTSLPYPVDCTNNSLALIGQGKREGDGFLQENGFYQGYPSPTHSTTEFEKSNDFAQSLPRKVIEPPLLLL